MNPFRPSDQSGRVLTALLLLIGIIILVLILLIFFANPDEIAVRQTEPTIIEPEISRLDDVKEYVDFDVIPKVTKEKSVGNILSGEHLRGDVLARISIVEYSNFTNNYSGIIQPELKEFIERNEQINWIFRHFPSPDDKNDYEAAYIGECVYQQLEDKGFWPYSDLVFEKGVGTIDELIGYGIDVGANREMLQSCLDTGETVKFVKDDKQIGYSKGKVRVAPTFFFVDNFTGNERIIEGIYPISFFEKIVEAMLKTEE